MKACEAGESDAWHPGKRLLDEFTVLDELGRGGMGTVYLVERGSDRELFAVKTLSERVLKDGHKRRLFLREIRTWIDLPDSPYLACCRFFRTIGDRTAVFAQ